MEGASRRSVIAAHLIGCLYGHWAVNDPRGSGSKGFIDLKFAPLGPIHRGRKPETEQPTRDELREFHDRHHQHLNFPIFWIDRAKRTEIAASIQQVIRQQGYTCYACAVCCNHFHMVIRTHRDKAQTMWQHFADAARDRMRLCFPAEIAPNHPVISARPYNVLLYTPDEVRGRVQYVESNPLKEHLPRQRWGFVTPYDGWPQHKKSP